MIRTCATLAHEGQDPGAVSMSDLPPQEATEEDTEFLDWLVDNGATFPKLMWPVYRWPGQPHDGERGVMVTEDIEPGECMFSIPSAVLLNREKCLASAIGEFSSVPHVHNALGKTAK